MKVGTKLASYLFKHLNKCHGKAEKWAEDVLRRLSSSIDVGGSDPIYHGQCGSIILYVYIYIYIYIYINVYRQQRGPKLNTHGRTAHG